MTNFSAPLSKWTRVRRFDLQSQCEAPREAYQQKPTGNLVIMLGAAQAQATTKASQCVAGDNARTQGKLGHSRFPLGTIEPNSGEGVARRRLQNALQHDNLTALVRFSVAMIISEVHDENRPSIWIGCQVKWPFDLRVFAVMSALWAACLAVSTFVHVGEMEVVDPVETIFAGVRFSGDDARLVLIIRSGNFRDDRARRVYASPMGTAARALLHGRRS